MRLPEDPEKLKLLTREYIIKHCKVLEKKADAFKKQLQDMRKEHERLHHCTLCDKYFERLLASMERAE